MQSFADFVNTGTPQTSSALPSFADFVKTNPVVTPKPTLMSKVGNAVSNYAQDSANTIGTLGNAILHPIDTYNKIVPTFTQPLIQAETKAGESLGNAYSDRGTKQLGDLAGVFSNFFQSILAAPLGGLSTLAENTPGLKQVADTLNIAPTAGGIATSYVTGKAFDVIPNSILPQASKDILKQPFQDLANTAGQIIVGGAIMDKLFTEAKSDKVITPEVATQIVDRAKLETQNHPEVVAENPPTFKQFLDKSSQINSSVQTDTNPLNQEVNSGRDTTSVPPEPTQPISPTNLETSLVPSSDQSTTIPETKTTGRTTQTLKPIEGTGETKARGLSQGVEAKAIENKLATNFGDLPEYQTVSMSDQASRAHDILTKDYESARSIALGEKSPPKGTLPESVFIAVENKAITEGDVQTLQDLASSKLSASATTMGQRIRTLAERDPTSPVGAIQEVQQARAEALKNRDITRESADTIKEIQQSMKKVATTKETWSSFVDSITC